MRKTRYLLAALFLAVSLWPHARVDAESRCYPIERFKVLDGQWVRDTLTKLVWQRQASATLLNWAEAQAYCTDAGLRLPTVKELRSIVDLTVASSGGTLDPNAFPDTPADSFWTSTPYAGASGEAWHVSFGGDTSGHCRVDNYCWARCVR